MNTTATKKRAANRIRKESMVCMAMRAPAAKRDEFERVAVEDGRSLSSVLLQVIDIGWPGYLAWREQQKAAQAATAAKLAQAVGASK